FTVRVTNRGPSPASGVVIADTLPAGVTLQSASPSVGAFDTATGRWTISTLVAGADGVLTLTTTVGAPRVLANNAVVVAQDQVDPNPLNNGSAASINAAPDADLRVTKAISDPAPGVGGLVTYTVAVTNLGPSDATTAAIADVLPAGLTFVSATASQGTYDETTGIWTIDAMPVTRTEILSIVARATVAGPVANTATRQSSAPVDPNPANDSGSVNAAASVIADLAVTKTPTTPAAAIGGPLAWTMVVTSH